MTSCAQPDAASSRSFHATAWMFVGALLAVLFVPWLFRQGMFWDGVVYGTISRNLAAGIGDAWHPTVTSTFLRHIREHPPLGFWLQAAYFWVFGDHFWVERVYSLTTLLVTGSVLLATWRWLLRDRPSASACCWLAAGLWAPFGMWCYRQNMLENTMGMFTALSVYAALRALDGRRGGAAFWSILAGLAITAAIMSKGPVGLFPAVTPAIAWLTLRRTLPLPLDFGELGSTELAEVSRAGEGRGEGKKSQTPHLNPLPKGEGTAQYSFAHALAVQSGVLCTVAISFGLVLVPAAAREYLAGYWQQQIVSSMRGEHGVVLSTAGHLNIVLLLARHLAVPALIVGGLMAFARLRYGVRAGQARPTRPMWFCLLTALSASLPIVLSPKQGGHYVAPSWPFYMFAITLWGMPALVELSVRLAMWNRHTLLRYGAGAMVAGTVVFSALTYGSFTRDQRLIELVNQVGVRVEPQAIIAVPSDSWYQFITGERLLIHTYLHRYHRISIWSEELQPAWGFDSFRLEPPDPTLVTSDQRVVTPSGLEWYPLVPRAGGQMAAAESDVR